MEEGLLFARLHALELEMTRIKAAVDKGHKKHARLWDCLIGEWLRGLEQDPVGGHWEVVQTITGIFKCWRRASCSEHA